MKTLLYFPILLTSTFLISCADLPIKTESLDDNGTTGTQCVSGTSKTGFLSPITSGNAPCTTTIKNCVNGSWVGPQLYDTCTNPNTGSQTSP